MMKVLVIAAHPDDEVLGCGGTIARLAKEGHDVHIAILGEGITSRFAGRELADPDQVRGLHDRSRQAARLLGAREPDLFCFADNRFDTIPLLDVVKTIEGLVEKISPRVIYTQHGGDLNVDHRIVFQATLTAARPKAGSCVEAIFAYEVPSSTEWAFHKFEPAFRPNVFKDIGKTLEVKLRAMEIYDSETRKPPHPRSREVLSAIARRWGSVAGLDAAEAFELVRMRN